MWQASELNRAATEIHRQGIIRVGPGLNAFFSPSLGWLISTTSPAPTVAETTTTPTVVNGLAAILGASAGNQYAWREAEFQNGVLIVKPGGQSGTLDNDPAIEQSGQCAIAVGTPVWLTQVFSVTFGVNHWVFNHEDHQPTSFVVNEMAFGAENPVKTP